MSKRNRREHGRIISVETKTRGDALADDFAAGVTSITVEDAGDFDEDGGWLLIGGQVVEFTECDDDTGIIALADPLTAAAEQGDPVQVWSELYEEVVDYQQALVELDGEYDNPDPVVAEVAEGVGSLPEGDRGRGGESCTLHRVSEDEWEVVGVGGRGRQSQGIRFEQDDTYTLTAAAVSAGVAILSLSHQPADESLTCVLAGVPQPPTEWSIDYGASTLTVPLSGWEQAGDVLWVHYAYRASLRSNVVLPYGSPGWRYLQVARTDSTNRAAVAFDDSTWGVARAPFGTGVGSLPALGWLPQATVWGKATAVWLRRSIEIAAGTALHASVRVDDYAQVYWNGALVQTIGDPAGYYGEVTFEIAAADVLDSNVLAIRAQDRDAASDPNNISYIDMKLTR